MFSLPHLRASMPHSVPSAPSRPDAAARTDARAPARDGWSGSEHRMLHVSQPTLGREGKVTLSVGTDEGWITTISRVRVVAFEFAPAEGRGVPGACAMRSVVRRGFHRNRDAGLSRDRTNERTPPPRPRLHQRSVWFVSPRPDRGA